MITPEPTTVVTRSVNLKGLMSTAEMKTTEGETLWKISGIDSEHAGVSVALDNPGRDTADNRTIEASHLFMLAPPAS
jgi:hypothetical protein